MMATGENAQRQIDELEAIQSIYGDDFMLSLHDSNLATLISAREDHKRVLPMLRLQVLVTPITVIVSLPFDYPCDENPIFSFDITTSNATLTRSQHAALEKDLNAHLKEALPEGSECLYEAFEWIKLHGDEYVDVRNPLAVPETLSDPVRDIAFLRFHHIKASSKRRNIQLWATELGLTGASRPGAPGIVVVEGSSENVSEFIRRLRQVSCTVDYSVHSFVDLMYQLNWKSMNLVDQVNTKDFMEHKASTSLFPEMREYNGLMDLLPLFTAAGMTEFFHRTTHVPKRK